jgi:hypothetical protein
MQRSETLERREGGLQKGNKKCAGVSVWSVVGGVALLAAAFILVKNIPDIRRYIKMEMM